jgi:hypothetical protein
MKPSPSKKLYTKMTPDELAALAFEALQDGDNVEFEIIAGSVDKRTANGWYYKRRLMGLTNLGMMFGGIYWKNRYLGSDENVASMETALKDVCSQVKVSVQAIRRLAFCDREQLFDAESINQELLEQYKKLLSDIVY